MPNHEAPAPQAPAETADVEQWEDELANPDTNEVVDTREVSPMATRISGAANRVSGYFENRAIKKAKRHANKENSFRTEQLRSKVEAGYNEALEINKGLDQDNKLGTADEAYDEAQQTNLAIDIADARDARINEQHEEAIGINTQFDKDARAEKRAERYQNGKAAVKGFGSKTFNAVRGSWAKTKSAGETAALFSLYSKDAAIQKGRDIVANQKLKAAERAAYKQDATHEAQKQADIQTALDEEIAMNEAINQNNELGGPDKVIDEAFAINKDMQHDEAIEINQTLRNAEMAKQVAEAARALQDARKQATRARRQATANVVKETVRSGIDTTKDVINEGASNAKEAVKEGINKGKEYTRAGIDYPKDKAKKLGRIVAQFARKSRNAARAGIDAAKASYQE